MCMRLCTDERGWLQKHMFAQIMAASQITRHYVNHGSTLVVQRLIQSRSISEYTTRTDHMETVTQTQLSTRHCVY